MWDASSTEALLLSLGVSAVATAAAIVAGVPLSRWLSRRRSLFFSSLEGLASLPLVIPPVVTGYLLLVAFRPAGVVGRALGALGVQIPFDWKGAVVAAAVVAFPLFLMISRVAFDRCDPRLEEAARTLHAGPLRVFATITLPQALPGLAAAAAVTFARAFGEFGATMMLAGNIPGRTRTVPQALYSELLAGRPEAAWGLTWVSFAVGLAAIMASQLLIRKLPGVAPPGARDA